MIDGRIAERGTFKEIMENGGELSRTFDEFVSKGQKDSEGEKAVDLEGADSEVDGNAKKRRAAGRGAALMKAEERNIGAVNLHVYKQYFQSGNGVALLPAIVVTTVLRQATLVLSNYWYSLITLSNLRGADSNACVLADRLVWWQELCVVFLRF